MLRFYKLRYRNHRDFHDKINQKQDRDFDEHLDEYQEDVIRRSKSEIEDLYARVMEHFQERTRNVHGMCFFAIMDLIGEFLD